MAYVDIEVPEPASDVGNKASWCCSFFPSRLLDVVPVDAAAAADELRNVEYVANAIHALATHAFRQMRGKGDVRASEF